VSNVLDRPRPSVRSSSATLEPGVAIWLRGILAATWAVGVGVASLIVLSLVVWAADSSATANAGGATRFAVQLWLLAHRSPLRISSGGELTIPPLVLTLLIGLLIARGAAIAARSCECIEGREFATVVASVAVPYAVMAAILAAVTSSSTFHPSIGAAFVCAGLVAGVASVIGVARGAGLITKTWKSLPEVVRGSLEAAGLAAGVMFAAATLLALGSLLAHTHQFGSIVDDYRGGSGEFSMILLSLLYVPNAICFALGYLVGPGFAVGSGTSVAYGGVHLGAMPAFPLLAGVPTGTAPWQIIALFVVTVVLAGALGGWRIARRPEVGLADRVRMSMGAGGLVAVGIAVISGFAGGPSGPGRLSAVGSSPWQVGLAAGAEIAVLATAVVVTRHVVASLRH
jgi:hypothetical protein